MTTPFMPALYVAAPAVVPARFGLFSVALMLDGGADGHWEGGTRWESVACEIAAITGAGCTDTDVFGNPKTPREGVDFIDATPFVVYGSSTCSPVGGQWDLARNRAMAHLLAGEERAVERAIYLGEAGNEMAMVDAATVNVTPVPGTAVSITEGVALLEAWLGANAHSVGVIHANPREVTDMAAAHLLAAPPSSATGSLSTLTGTLVASEGGMSGLVGPDGAAAPAGTHWIYATGRPVLRRSQPFFTPPERGASLNTSTNDLTQLAERIYVASWDCGTAAVLVDDDLGGASGGGGFDPALDAQRVVVVDENGDPVPDAPAVRTTKITRFASPGPAGVTAPGAYAIVAGRESYTVAVVSAASAASPTLDGVALPVGSVVSFTARNYDTLEAAALVTVAGDDVVVTELS